MFERVEHVQTAMYKYQTYKNEHFLTILRCFAKTLICIKCSHMHGIIYMILLLDY